MLTPPGFLLFSGANERAVLALARAFEETGAAYAVIARDLDDHFLRSSYRHRVCAVRESKSLSLPILETLITKASLQLGARALTIVPSSEFLNTFLLGLDREALKRDWNCDVPLVGRDLYDLLTNKSSATSLFSSLGIRTPALVEDPRRAMLPIVAKPLRNVGADGVVRYPILILDETDRATFLERADVAQYFGQEFIQGESNYLLCYFSKDGSRVFRSSQVNDAQQPGGKSIVMARTSDFHTSAVAGTTISMMGELGFHGFAMVEFIVDARGPCFIEVNPRPWGPLQLCLDHGCGIVEGFIGDAMTGNSQALEAIWLDKGKDARYLWLGGMAIGHRNGRLRWNAGIGWRVGAILRSLRSDIYLRRDSWRIFLRELR